MSVQQSGATTSIENERRGFEMMHPGVHSPVNWVWLQLANRISMPTIAVLRVERPQYLGCRIPAQEEDRGTNGT